MMSQTRVMPKRMYCFESAVIGLKKRERKQISHSSAENKSSEQVVIVGRCNTGVKLNFITKTDYTIEEHADTPSCTAETIAMDAKHRECTRATFRRRNIHTMPFSLHTTYAMNCASNDKPMASDTIF
ncbi:hypothetical protein TNCV_205911 [Trichonephila clavipes]|nr:hypothetical protein TNCV_205911 [Trichonephila clavipes]